MGRRVCGLLRIGWLRREEKRNEEISMPRVGVAAVIPSVAADRADWLVEGDGDGAITGE